MTERDRIIDAFRNCITIPKCKDCPWNECDTLNNRCIEIPADLALAVMRELAAQKPVGGIRDAINAVEEVSAVDAAPMVHGRWVEEKDRLSHWHCSECGKVQGMSILFMNYCPNCGAKMGIDRPACGPDNCEIGGGK